MDKYLSILGLFLVGVIIVIVGVYYFISYASAVGSFEYQLGIILMLVGLLVTGVGAIRGKRAMRSVGYFAEYPPGAPAQPVLTRPEPRPAPAMTPTGPTPPAQAPSRPTPTVPVTQSRAEAKPAEKVIKVIVCPKCGSENQVTDMFCFNCGKKLRPKRASK